MGLRSLISVSRATIAGAQDDETIEAMNNPNWTKQVNLDAERLPAERPVERTAAAIPVTEDELEAYRFRGTPIRRTVSPVARQPLAASHQGVHRHALPASPTERALAPNEVEAEDPDSEKATAKVPRTPLLR